jgi:glycosyltransferase involved in cell wall biosynthesis
MASRQLGSVVCLSTADWDAPLWTNKQHMAQGLSRSGVDVLYVESLGLRKPGLGSADRRRILRRLLRWRPVAKRVSSHLAIDSPLVIPLHHRRRVREVNRFLLKSRLSRNVHRLRWERPVLWAYAPLAVHLYDPAKYSGLVYHCVDNLAAFPGSDSATILCDEASLATRADVVLCSSLPLCRRMEALGARDVRYWPNPADVAAFEDIPIREHSGEVTLGFVGAVQEHKVDVDLLRAVAEERPDWRIAMIGPLGEGLAHSAFDVGAMPSNVVFHGPLPREALPAALSRFSAGVIPYRRNEYTAGVFPMKVFEYMAAGLPIISTSLPSLVGHVPHISFADNASDFVSATERSLRIGADERQIAREFAHGHSWPSRITEATALIAELVGPHD